jgi:hypothetical protein
MLLEGSCHCGAVRFSVSSHTPVPFMHCYCAVCRKTQGGGGYTINLAGDAETLDVTGRRNMTVYRAREELVDGGAEDDGLSPLRRHFCKKCGSALYAWDSRWPELVHPFASAIDTPLPKPPEIVHLMLASAPSWVDVPKGKRHTHFDGYPEESIEDWHKTRGLWQE